MDNSISLHQRNLQCLAIELYKTFNDISPDIMKDIFPLNTSSIYDIRNTETFYTRPVKSVYKDTNSSFLVPKVWKLIPESIKSIDLLIVFKLAIKNGSLVTVHARLKQKFHMLAFCSECINSSFFAHLNILIYLF